MPAPVKFGFRAFIYPTPGNTEALRNLLIVRHADPLSRMQFSLTVSFPKFASILQSVGPLVDAEPFTAQWFPTQVYNKSGPTEKFIVFTFAETHEDL